MMTVTRLGKPKRLLPSVVGVVVGGFWRWRVKLESPVATFDERRSWVEELRTVAVMRGQGGRGGSIVLDMRWWVCVFVMGLVLERPLFLVNVVGNGRDGDWVGEAELGSVWLTRWFVFVGGTEIVAGRVSECCPTEAVWSLDTECGMVRVRDAGAVAVGGCEGVAGKDGVSVGDGGTQPEGVRRSVSVCGRESVEGGDSVRDGGIEFECVLPLRVVVCRWDGVGVDWMETDCVGRTV